MAEWFRDPDAAYVFAFVTGEQYDPDAEVGRVLAWFTANPDVWQVDCRGVVDGRLLWFGAWTRRGWLHEMGAP